MSVRSVLATGGTLLLVMLPSCSLNPGPTAVTKVVFDGESETLTGPVSCVGNRNGELVILAVDGQKSVRVLLRRGNRLVAEKVGIRIGGATGFTANSDDMWATKVDDVYTVNGRMPPNPGEIARHDFTVEVRCPHESSPYTPANVP